MEEICRCCLKTDTSFIEIPSEDEKKFQCCTDNKDFNKNDGLSQSCCRYCYIKINDIHAFQKECKESDLILRKLLSKKSLKNESNEFSNWSDIQYDDDTLRLENMDDTIISSPVEEILEIVNYAGNKYVDESPQISINCTANFSCIKCKRSFKSAKNLNIHVTIVHMKNPDNKSFKCEICLKIFGSERNLKIHVTRKHQTVKDNVVDFNTMVLENNLFKCRFCDEDFKEQSLLLKHIRIKHFKNSELITQEELNDVDKFETVESFLTPYETKSGRIDYSNITEPIKSNVLVQNERNIICHENNFKETYRNLQHIPKYHCDICGIKFTRKQFLVTHFHLEHLKIMKYTCKLCWKGFVSSNLFHNHFIRIHLNDEIKPTCEMNTYLKNNELEYSNCLWKDTKFTDNTNLNNIKINYRCQLCDKILSSKISLKLHFSSVHLKLTNISNKCNICWKTFRFKYSLLKHRKIHNLTLKYNCKLCGLGFVTKSLFLCHLRYTHMKSTEKISTDYIENCLLTNKKKINSFHHQLPQKNLNKTKLPIELVHYNCDYCNNTFTTKRALINHLKLKHEKYIIPNQLECSICNKIFPKHNLFRDHMKNDHPAEYALYIQVDCPICNKSYTKKSITKHLKTHQNRPKDIQCPECGRTFFSRSTYNYHQKTHTNEKPFKCDHCSKAFITKYQLGLHSITHSNIERPKRYQCNYCGKGCASTSEFTVHMRIHTKERPFKCTQCDKGFLTKSHLRNHFVTHTGEKNYKCKEDGCKSAYGSVSSLKKHYYMVHCPEDQKKFECDLCLKRFGRKTFLNQHRKAHGKNARLRKT